MPLPRSCFEHRVASSAGSLMADFEYPMKNRHPTPPSSNYHVDHVRWPHAPLSIEFRAAELVRVHHAIGSRSVCCNAHEFILAAKKIELLVTHAAFPYEINHLVGRDRSGIRHIVNSERDAPFPAKQAGFHKLLQLRDGVCAPREEAQIAHQLRKIVARVFELVEGKAHRRRRCKCSSNRPGPPHPAPLSRCKRNNCSDES